MLAQARWAVVGDVLHPRKPARAVVERLEAAGKTVHRVSPRDRTGTLPKTLGAVAAAGEAIDVVDLIINPRDGIKVVEEMVELGVRAVFIQPGAGSEEIEALCKREDIEVHNGCVLREL